MVQSMTHTYCKKIKALSDFKPEILHTYMCVYIISLDYTIKRVNEKIILPMFQVQNFQTK